MAKRKIVVHIATSADGYIARKDGNIHRGLPLDAEGRRKPMWQALDRVFAARQGG